MSEQPNPEVKKEDEKKDLTKKEEDDEEEEYSCGLCWRGYCACIFAISIKNGIVCVFASCWYPIKERCSTCCDNCDKKMNPHKDPYFDPYDGL